MGVYQASKADPKMATMGTASEWNRHSKDVNVVRPGLNRGKSDWDYPVRGEIYLGAVPSTLNG